MDIRDIIVYAVAVLMLGSLLFFVKAALFDHRPQKLGLVLAVLGIPLYMIYYSDRWPFGGDLPMRHLISPLDQMEGADTSFVSDLAPAGLVGALLLVHVTVLQRVAVRERLQRVHDPIASFFAGTTFLTLVGGIIVTTFSWGWMGAVIVAAVSAAVYLGALAVIGAIIELTVELSKLFLVWIKRKAFTVATWITRLSSWVSSLSGRLVSRALIERIRADTQRQETIFLDEQDAQDARLYEAYLRDRARRRRLNQTQRVAGADADEPAVPPVPEPTPPTVSSAPAAGE